MAKENSKLDFVDMVLLVPFALLFDFLSIIPLLGNLFSLGALMVFRLIFFLKGIKGKGMNAALIAAMIVEGIPLLSALPGLTAFVFFVYFAGRVEEELLSPQGKEKEENLKKAA